MKLLPAARLLGALLALALALPAAAAASGDAVAAGYHEVLLDHTRHSETLWNEEAGHYELQSFGFAVVLGNAVLLRGGDYDAARAGVSRETLEDRTVRSIAHFAATNRWVDPDGEWGGRVYFDSTFEAYFVAAARLLWDRLDDAARAHVDTITRAAADYVVALGTGEDPRSPGWLVNGLSGGFRGDSKIEEMGARTMPLAAALAYLPDDAAAPRWREWLIRWSANMTGLPAADAANPALLGGRPIADWNRAQNVFDTFAVENHGSFAPHYQGSFAAYPGRNAAHFLIAGRPLPAVLERGPNARELAATLRQVGTDAGVGAYPMVADRYHLYGRDVLPLAYQSTVLASADAARAERMLLARLGPYVHHPPEYRLTKFSGEPHYEPEARAELAIAYLLHDARDRLAGDVRPVGEGEYFRRASAAVDYGAEVGMVAHQTPQALALAVTKPGYVKFAWLPDHDDWLVDPSGAAPAFLPSTTIPVLDRSVAVYRDARDGYDGTATLLRTPAGLAGFATLPTGTAVYATSGLGAGEGAVRLHNLTMPGIRGLDGDRTFHGRDGAVTLAAEDGGDGGVDELRFAPVEARYVRFVGARPATQYGYSLWDFEVYASAGGPDVARGMPTTASSHFGAGYEPARATDGDPATRWAVSRADRPRPDSWLAVDLGAPQTVSRVRLRWEVYATEYGIEVSSDGEHWRPVATVPASAAVPGDWVNVDDRAGFVVRGSANPITATSRGLTLSDGPASGAAGMVVEARPREDAAATAAAARRPQPTGGPPALRASLADGYLSLFNLGGEDVRGAPLRLPQDGPVRLYRGSQRTVDGGTVYEASLDAATARLEAPRFVLAAHAGGDVRVTVHDSSAATVTNLDAGRGARLTLATSDGSRRARVTVPAAGERTVRVPGVAATPVSDLARLARTFPTSPLPDGMTDPDHAVDGDPATAWRAPAGGRMVVDLGRVYDLRTLRLRWTPGAVAPVAIEVSADGAAYERAAVSDGREREESVPLGGARGRYVAIRTQAGPAGAAGLAELELR